MGPVIGGGAGEDGVVVAWVALRFHQPLVSAVGAAGEVRKPSILAVECSEDRLTSQGRDVVGSIPPVGDLFGMSQRPASPRRDRRIVAHVGAGSHIAAAKS